MASIYKHSRGRTPYWIGVFTDETGKRRHRSTRAKNRGAAEEMCQKWQRQADKLRKSHTLQNKDLILETFITATQKAERGEFTDATARKMLNELLAASGQSPMELRTTEQFLTDWINSKDIAKAPGTAKRYRHTVETFVAHIGAKAKKNLAALVPRDIETFRDGQLSDGKTPSTANMAVKTIRIPLNLAHRQGLIPTNPANAVELLDAQSQTRRAFTVEQLSDVLAVSDWEWRGLILIGVTCGLRIGDASRLTWKAVDLERKVIHYFPEKARRGVARKPVETPILPELEDWLLAWEGEDDSPNAPLLPKLSKIRPGGCNGLSSRFQKLMHTADIQATEDARKVKKKGRRFNDLTFHSLRHTFISLMANIGVRREVRMKLAGHSSNVHDRYTHHEAEAIHKELSAFPRIGKAKT